MKQACDSQTIDWVDLLPEQNLTAYQNSNNTVIETPELNHQSPTAPIIKSNQLELELLPPAPYL